MYCSFGETLDRLAENLVVFYLNSATVFVLSIGFFAVYKRIGAITGAMLALSIVAMVMWAICVLDPTFMSYVGLQALLAVLVTLFVSSSVTASADHANASEEAQPHISRKLVDFARRTRRKPRD